MRFEWDPVKSQRNRISRGLPFSLAVELFEGFVTEEVAARQDYGEKRMKAIGRASGYILACVYTDRGPVRRIISLRFASRKERDGYHKSLQG